MYDITFVSAKANAAAIGGHRHCGTLMVHLGAPLQCEKIIAPIPPSPLLSLPSKERISSNSAILSLSVKYHFTDFRNNVAMVEASFYYFSASGFASHVGIHMSLLSLFYRKIKPAKVGFRSTEYGIVYSKGYQGSLLPRITKNPLTET